jgi:hypothetical protein
MNIQKIVNYFNKGNIMKIKLNINAAYIAAFVIVVVSIICTWKILNSNNGTKDAIAAIAVIVENNNITTQTKLDGINDGLVTLNENDKVTNGKLDLITTDLGLAKEDIALLQESVNTFGLNAEESQKALLIQIEGLQSTLVDVRKQQGYSNVTAQKLISYNRCESSNRSNCHSLLD